MGLVETQRVLARLYTDAALRERFFASPSEVGEEFGLSADESRQLARLSAQRVNFFASSLHHKRLQEVRELLPLTSRVLGEKLPLLFRQYAETHLPEGAKKHREDASAFAAHLEKLDSSQLDAPAWLADLSRYEERWLAATSPGTRILIARFRYEAGAIAREVARGNVQPLTAARPTIACWFRLSPRGRVRYASLSLPQLPGLR